MHGALVAGLLMTAGVVPAGEMIPGPGDFRFQTIHKAAGEKEWPFVAESGMLSCIKMFGQRAVYFMPEETDSARAFNLDVDIFSMSMVNLGMTNILAPYDDTTQLIHRIAPFVTMGQRLCDQDPGTFVTGPEL
ncbi:hypothetical protein [Shinella kummerowiae]|uniref:hypothetical protein n=1 Tax=Shinella kummerowiae TaxID=417745 RepID=UPI0021B63700|nr:hypothetical protein [Shinella kummerowiae]MCT7667032.1 hypothetical protein [Shinella kummerowiae]